VLVTFVIAGLVIPEILRVIVELAAIGVDVILVTFITCPLALQFIAEERELVAESVAFKPQAPLAIVTLVGKFMTTAAPVPKGLLI
jgi:hypothetical protein